MNPSGSSLLKVFRNICFVVVLFSDTDNKRTIFLLERIIDLISGSCPFESTLGIPFYMFGQAMNPITFIFLQAMGKAVESTMLSMVREIVFGVGLALLLPIFFGLDGVLYSMPVADILTAIISILVICKTNKQLW